MNSPLMNDECRLQLTVFCQQTRSGETTNHSQICRLLARHLYRASPSMISTSFPPPSSASPSSSLCPMFHCCRRLCSLSSRAGWLGFWRGISDGRLPSARGGMNQSYLKELRNQKIRLLSQVTVEYWVSWRPNQHYHYDAMHQVLFHLVRRFEKWRNCVNKKT